MSPSIEILPDHVANQIAAGEVVERPASVVKELVENALDAGASRVEVTLRNGGKTEIRVADDGCGMERRDALLALDRHATSKIRSAEDLGRVSSFGFRGEALPSIAAVSRFELETSTGRGAGTRIRVEGGRVRSVEEVARRRGTTVSVRGLFHDVPARAKFLRAASAETRAASEALLLLALSNLETEFRLTSNDRELLHLPVAGSPRERVSAIWGPETSEALLRVDREGDAIRLGGLVERPDAARRGARRRYLFVNGRPFSDPGLTRAADEAYRTTLAPGSRASLFLYLAVPPAAVDVNVHPAKAEVRFRDRPGVERAIREAVRARLADLESAAPLGGRPPGESGGQGWVDRHAGAAVGASGAPEVAEGSGAAEEPSGAAAAGATAEAAGATAEAAGARAAPGAAPAGEGEPAVREPTPQLAFFVPAGSGPGAEEPGAPPRRGPDRPDLWQLHRSYILASTREGLLIIDQHSAHERILYEEIMRRFGDGGGESQRLLFPATLRLSPAEHSAVEELSGLLARIGFEVEPFGDRTVILRASPQPHPWFDPERCIREMIHELTHGSPLVDAARNQHERIAKSLACKGAIKAGQPLSAAEMAELVDRLFATELPGHDVHGRPTIVRLGLEELERRFGRT